MLTFVKKKPALTGGISVAVILVIWLLFFRGGDEGGQNIAIAVRKNLIQEVSVTGRVKPAQAVDLAFEKSGRIDRVLVKSGDHVYGGQLLVQLDNSELTAQLDEAEANVKIQQAKLDELIRGTRPEEVEVQKAEVQDAKQTLIDKASDAFTKADDAVRNKADQLFSNARSANPQFNYPISNSTLEYEIENGRFNLEGVLDFWQSEVAGISTSSASADLKLYIASTKSHLDQVKVYLDKVALAVSSLSVSTSLSQTTLDGYKSDISTARTNVNTAINNVSAAEADWIIQQKELSLQESGTASEVVLAQRAQVEQVEAKFRNIQAQIAKTFLRSPIAGLVTKQDAEVGEIVAASEKITSVISDARLEIEVNVPEADVAKIAIQDLAKITLDAYGSDLVFESKIITIEPAETIIEGVATYKTILQFVKDDARIKSGMTANIDIVTDQRENVIVIPQRYVITRNGDKIVRMMKNGLLEDVKVTVGLRGSDGNIEILSGLNEGDRVVFSE